MDNQKKSSTFFPTSRALSETLKNRKTISQGALRIYAKQKIQQLAQNLYISAHCYVQRPLTKMYVGTIEWQKFIAPRT